MEQLVRITVAVLSATLAGCATLPDGSRWGERASFSIGWRKTGEAALQAAKDPWVWGPLVGAAVLQVDNWDHEVSDWAVDETPVFGSVDDADDISDDLKVAAGVGYVVSLLATPSGPAGPDWWKAKGSGLMVGLGAIGAELATTGALKSVAGRERPNDRDDESFPSGHAAFAAVTDTLTVSNLRSIEMNGGARTALIVGADALTIATGWARVEAGEHYPSDVLVGMTIGNFFGRMFSEAFLGETGSQRVAFAFEPMRGGGEIAWNWRF